MPSENMVQQFKPAEMSFSDWKKMKGALNTTAEEASPEKDPPRSTQPATNKNANNNFNNNYNEYRNQPSLHYFECLKQNNQHIFGGNMGFCNSMPPVPPMPIFSRRPPPNMMNFFHQQQNIQRSNIPDLRAGSSNFLPGGNNFMMPTGGIPQQPFPMNNYPNDNRMTKPFPFYNCLPVPNFPQQFKAINNHKVSKNINGSKVIKNTTSAPISEPLEKRQETADDTQNTSKTKSKKQKLWNPKPPRPPTLTAITTESREEKQRMWREYRMKMKPFKNREFYNAKRVVQRLGKKKPEELEEKEIERLARAKKVVAAHKTMLDEKAAKRWTLVNEPAPNPTATSTSEKPSCSGYVPTTTQQSVTNESTSSLEPVDKNDLDHSQTAANTNGDQLVFWNNFVPGGVVYPK